MERVVDFPSVPMRAIGLAALALIGPEDDPHDPVALGILEAVGGDGVA